MYECCLISIVQIFFDLYYKQPLKVVWLATPFAKWRKGLVALVYPTRSNGMYDAIFVILFSVMLMTFIDQHTCKRVGYGE